MMLKLIGTTICFLVFFGVHTGMGQNVANKKNVLIIITDEQSADAMSCVAGNQYLHTPNIDQLAKKGIMFTRAYAANPLCVPSRSSMFTGRYLHTLGILDNKNAVPATAHFPVMGTFFTENGYETGYVGKWHIPAFPLKNKAICGFQWSENNQLGGADNLLPGSAIHFINKKREKPFLLVVSFVNPHNICEWARGDKLPDGDIGRPASLSECPPLLSNHNPTINESDINRDMRLFTQSSPQFPVSGYDTAKWREYRWAYYRMVEKVDGYIGIVLDALKASGQYENTLIVFLSDHGDMQGAHHWNQKTVFYEESARVPFILSAPDLTPGKTGRLVNTGIDLIPTICAYTGIDLPPDMPGCSALQTNLCHPYIVVSNKLSVGSNIFPDKTGFQPEGRMLRSNRYKYWIYDTGSERESLFDLQKDPGEMHDLARLPEYKKTLEQRRQYLKEWAKKYKDDKALQMLQYQNL